MSSYNSNQRPQCTKHFGDLVDRRAQVTSEISTNVNSMNSLARGPLTSNSVLSVGGRNATFPGNSVPMPPSTPLPSIFSWFEGKNDARYNYKHILLVVGALVTLIMSVSLLVVVLDRPVLAPGFIKFNITQSISDKVEDSLILAANEWNSALVDDTLDLTLGSEIAINDCRDDYFKDQTVVEGMQIIVEFENIDGPGGILGESLPCLFQLNEEGVTPFLRARGGIIRLDSADLNDLNAELLFRTSLHEIGHVLGLGNMWYVLELIDSANSQYTGAQGIAAFNGLGGVKDLLGEDVQGIPLEQNGGLASRYSHWDEATFGNELMTPTLGKGSNPLSKITLQALQDIGYSVDLTKAESYAIPSKVATVAPTDETEQLRGTEQNSVSVFSVDLHNDMGFLDIESLARKVRERRARRKHFP